jgi:hypothetical protein
VDDIDAHDQRHQADRLQTVLDALNHPDAAGDAYAVLDAVCAVGAGDDGLRKTYNHLDADDLLGIIREHQRRATVAAVAALRLTDVVRDLLRALRTTGAPTLGDLLETRTRSID